MKKLIIISSILLNACSNDCTRIKSVPALISKSGKYCLANDVSVKAGSSAIQINSDNVTIDLQNHTLSSPISLEGRGSGIESYGHSNIEVKNGIIKNFMYGVRIQDSDLLKLQNNLPDAMHNINISNVSFEFNTFRGIQIQAKNVSVNKCQFRSIGGTKVFADAYSMGVEISGQDCRVSDNLIKDIYPVGSGEAVGISISAFGDNCVISNNSLSNTIAPILGRTFALWLGNPLQKPITVTNNFVDNYSYFSNDQKNHSRFIDNKLNAIRCATYFKKSRKYYLSKKPCLEEDTVFMTKKADEGDIQYQYKLALHYLEGLWADQDKEKSNHYFSMASNQGHEEATRLLKKYWG